MIARARELGEELSIAEEGWIRWQRGRFVGRKCVVIEASSGPGLWSNGGAGSA